MKKINKEIILAPRYSGKSYFIANNIFKHNIICNEYLSTINYIPKNVNMHATSAMVPETHHLYKSWNDLYKIGIEIFNGYSEDKRHILIFNGLEIISFIREKYTELPIKIVLLEEERHKKNWLNTIEKHKDSQKTVYDVLLKDQNEISSSVLNIATWCYVKEERKEYLRISEIYNLPVYSSFEEAVKDF